MSSDIGKYKCKTCGRFVPEDEMAYTQEDLRPAQCWDCWDDANRIREEALSSLD